VISNEYDIVTVGIYILLTLSQLVSVKEQSFWHANLSRMLELILNKMAKVHELTMAASNV